MLPNKLTAMTGAASPNQIGGVHGEKDQHGRTAGSGVGDGGTLSVGWAGGEGSDHRRTVRGDWLESQACGAHSMRQYVGSKLDAYEAIAKGIVRSFV
jgi:hypothetical protein